MVLKKCVRKVCAKLFFFKCYFSIHWCTLTTAKCAATSHQKEINGKYAWKHFGIIINFCASLIVLQPPPKSPFNVLKLISALYFTPNHIANNEDFFLIDKIINFRFFFPISQYWYTRSHKNLNSFLIETIQRLPRFHENYYFSINISRRGPNLWNKLLDNPTKTISSLDQFKIKVKQQLLLNENEIIFF